MKTLILIAIALSSLSAFSQLTQETYSCKFKVPAPISIEENFELGVDLGFTRLVRELNGHKHYFEFDIFAHNGNTIFQFMQGIDHTDGWSYPTNDVATHLAKGQKTFKQNTFLCAQDSVCWSIECNLNEHE